MNNSVFFQPLDGPIPTLKRVFVILWQSGTVRLFLRIALFFVVPATAILLAFVYTALHITIIMMVLDMLHPPATTIEQCHD